MKDEYTLFRRWLIEKLSRARWAQYRDDTDEEMAVRLGVQPEVLSAARLVHEERQADNPKKTRPGMPRANRRVQKMIYLEPPGEVYAEWSAIRDGRKATNSMLFRSALHHVLRLKWQPAWLSTRGPNGAWLFHGRWLGQVNIREHNYRIRAPVSERMELAMQERAARTGVTPAALARWAVLSLAEGKLRSLRIVPPSEALYKQHEYCVDPKIVAEMPDDQ